VKFDPWWFSGQEDLALRFFEQLSGTLSSKQIVSDELRNKLANFARIVSRIPVPYAWTGEVAESLLRPEGNDIYGLKEEISARLEQQTPRILFIFDDIDRLEAEEVRQLFRVIKAVANFPNVTYLLAFDKEVAVTALRDAQNIPGEAYPEKIVQVPFDLPMPDETSLRQVLAEKLAKLT
jgi:predicted KAP-like P-loop ATPase